MPDNVIIKTIQTELEAGMELAKCQKCGCMQETLDTLAAVLPEIGIAESRLLVHNVVIWQARMQPVQYSCLGCAHCFPAVAQNLLAEAFPTIETTGLNCDFQTGTQGWPPVAGEYVVVDKAAPVAVSTLANVTLTERLAHLAPAGLAIVGKTETENIGLDKIIKNVITNPALQYLILAGRDSTGHQTGQTLLALAKNGVDAGRHVINAPGKRPVLRNVSTEEIQAFRNQVVMIDMIGTEDLTAITDRIATLAEQAGSSCRCCSGSDLPPPAISTPPTVVASEPEAGIRMDSGGYFVIVPLADRRIISVEHYRYDHFLLRVIEGETARSLYMTIIDNGWVTELSHAAYLGKELARAEVSLQQRTKYVQDGA